MMYQKISKSASSNTKSAEKSASIAPQSVPSSLTPIAHFHDFTQVPVYSPTIQAKLTIGSPNDRYEQEADRVAAQVVQQLQRPASIQRQDELNETIQAKSMLQRPDSIVTGEASTQLASEINNRRGGGQPLEVGLQQSMGRAMGADFSRVRVHTDGGSDALNRSIQAKAFTTGQDVFFRQGAYDPGSRGGQELLTHELTHVAQQDRGRLQRQQMPIIGNASRKPIIQRVIENATYNESDKVGAEDAKAFFSLYDKAVQEAYSFAVTVPSLGAYSNLNGYTRLWLEKWNDHLSGKRPKLLAATFGYVIESLVSEADSEYRPKILGEYSVDTQVTVGGTRPDLLLRLKKGSIYIAWLDLTASGSADHIFTKDDWSSKINNFAEVTYPSLEPGTLAFMQKNKDNKGGLSEEEFKKRMAAAKEEHKKLKQQWREFGQKFAFSQIWKEMRQARESLNLDQALPRKFILEKLKTTFKVDNLDEKLVPSILCAMQVSSTSWGYGIGYSTSEKAGDAWLIDNPLPES